MKYVVLGTLSAEWATKQEQRYDAARKKLDELKIKVEAVHYTQGRFDFVDVLDAPDADAMLAFSVWYATQGFGRLQSMPAFDHETMTAAMKKAR